MNGGELLRVRLCFGALGAIPVFLAGWLGYVQVAQAGELGRGGTAPLRLSPEAADRQSVRTESVRAPRGTIVDRRSRPLAMDREVYEVRARITVPKRGRQPVAVGYLREYLDRVAGAFAMALASDPGLADRDGTRRGHDEQLRTRLHRDFRTATLPATGDVPDRFALVRDVAIARDVDTLEVIAALRALDVDPALGDWLQVHLIRTQSRHYNEHEYTYGLVGQHYTRTVAGPQGPEAVAAANGLESLAALEPLGEFVRRFRRDGDGHAYFVAPLADPLKPAVLHTTIDLDLQRLAARELAAEADRAAEGGRKQPLWAAMVLVEIDTGDVLAAAQWHRDAKTEIGLASTPYQSLYEPGSIVKPLVAAYSLELGRIDWNHVYDCRPGGRDYRALIGHLGRAKPVVDDHLCGDLTPHDILVNSSNIGACYLGLQIERDEWREYMRYFGFGESLDLPLPNEPGMSKADHPKHSFRGSFDPKTPVRRFLRDSAISFSFGYEFQVTALQMARAYLRLYRGDQSQLRLVRGVEIGGDWIAAPATIGGRRLRPEVVHRIQNAMIDVVRDDPAATGRLLHQRMRKELGIDLHGVVAGKTGTAVSTVYLGKQGTQRVRNASFVGVLPAEAPKWLAVCVLQRDDEAKFYGGTFAAPPVVRLLLRADQLTRYRAPGQDSQGVAADSSLSPGDSGWSRGAPETSVVGR